MKSAKGRKWGQLARPQTKGKPKGVCPGIYQSFPAEDVAVEADPIFREVESALKKNVSLECT